MKLINNYKEWIKPEWIDWLLTHNGLQLPKDALTNNELENYCSDVGERDDWFVKWGYKTDTVFSDQYKDELFPFDITFPFIPEDTVKWTFMRYTPGQFLPLHSDDIRFKNERRLLMMLQDYEQGHITIHDEQLVKDYKAGDLFHFVKPDAIHGCANIGRSTRLVLSLVVYNKGKQ